MGGERGELGSETRDTNGGGNGRRDGVHGRSDSKAGDISDATTPVAKDTSLSVNQHTKLHHKYSTLSEIYYGYALIHQAAAEPFTSLQV